jgi:hypothetical protein
MEYSSDNWLVARWPCCPIALIFDVFQMAPDFKLMASGKFWHLAIDSSRLLEDCPLAMTAHQ